MCVCVREGGGERERERESSYLCRISLTSTHELEERERVSECVRERVCVCVCLATCAKISLKSIDELEATFFSVERAAGPAGRGGAPVKEGVLGNYYFWQKFFYRA